MKITINKAQLHAKVDTAWKKGLRNLTSEIRKDCNQYVKYDNGDLERSSMRHSILEQGKIVWDTPYAKRQYWEIKTSLTPGRTWKWCETAKQKYKDRWKRQAQRGFQENL